MSSAFLLFSADLLSGTLFFAIIPSIVRLQLEFNIDNISLAAHEI
jgi:hypothetical protein